MSYFKDKVVVVTGGSEGIGKALVEELMAQGAKVATCARNYDKIYNLQLQFANVLFHAQTCDVSNEQDCKKFINSTIKLFGGIDILINNAGISMRALFKDVDLDVMRKVMDINFWGAVLEITGEFLMTLFFLYYGVRRGSWTPFRLPDWDFLLVAMACAGVVTLAANH